MCILNIAVLVSIPAKDILNSTVYFPTKSNTRALSQTDQTDSTKKPSVRCERNIMSRRCSIQIRIQPMWSIWSWPPLPHPSRWSGAAGPVPGGWGLPEGRGAALVPWLPGPADPAGGRLGQCLPAAGGVLLRPAQGACSAVNAYWFRIDFYGLKWFSSFKTLVRTGLAFQNVFLDSVFLAYI